MAGGRRGESMKILSIDPSDSADEGPWVGERWDRVVDLGLAGQKSYKRWSNQFHCPVSTLRSLRPGFDNFRRVRSLMDLGSGRLIDEFGLDWWELMSMLWHGELETLVLLQRFVESLSPCDEIHVSRAGFYASVIGYLLPDRVKTYAARHNSGGRRLRHYAGVAQRLSPSQIIDVLCDKYDQGYQFRARLGRGRLARNEKNTRRPAVLIPSAYVNVSRTGIAYANTFPEEDFLLVSTRRSGWIRDLPANVEAEWLSRYASLRDRGAENRSMLRKWDLLLNDLRSVAEFDALYRLGSLDLFPRWLKRGFEVRDAWLNVLDREPVRGVLCADDNNPYTRIPMLLAQSRGLPNIACHHGAFDSGYFFKGIYGDAIWVKGRMEQDYLVRQCGTPAGKVEVCAPATPARPDASECLSPSRLSPSRLSPSNSERHILFLSEMYEDGGGRAKEFYRDILPPLADLALANDRKLIVKLHPTESKRERAKIIGKLLSNKQMEVTHIVSGPLTEQLMADAWFGITVLSTVAMECAIRGIPCFLCKWLEYWPYGYVDQFIRFEVGRGLNDQSEINRIPEYLENHTPSASVRQNCWQAAAPGCLRERLTSADRSCAAAAS
jgi:hypothetical protein